MAKKKSSSKQNVRSDRGAEIVDQLEQAFLAGLGALSNAQEAGGKAFETLVEQGLSFRKGSTERTEELIDNVQDAIREMTEGAQSRATGLLSHMRDTPQMSKLQNVFDDRVADALERMGVASKQRIDELDAKLDKVLSAMEGKKSPKKTTAKKTRKKATKKKAAKKKVAKKKVTRKKASKKKVAKKKVARKAAKKTSTRKKAAKKTAKKKATR